MTRHVRLTQLDGPLPNLALLRLAAWHRAKGDEVRFSRSPFRHLDEPEYSVVYGSAIFTYSAARIARLKAEFPGAIVGGTGTGDRRTIEDLAGFADCGLAYDLFPRFRASIGFTQRGCRLACPFCVVPTKEGRPRDASSIAEIWRGKPWPKHLHLLDNDFFGGPAWRDRIAEIQEGGFRVSFTQGVNVRVITLEAAIALASVEYRDDSFSRSRLYTAWDNLGDERVFFRGIDRLELAGVPASHVMAYMLVGYDPAETWEAIFHRFDRMVARGIKPYPMVFDPTRLDLKRFQRWAVRGFYRFVPFEEYDAGRKAAHRFDHPDLFAEAAA